MNLSGAQKSSKDMYLMSSSKDGCLRLWDVNVQFCVDVIPSAKNEVTGFLKMPMLGANIYMYCTNTEDLVFLELGETKSDEGSVMTKNYQERGRFKRDKFSKVNKLVCDYDRNLVFLVNEKNGIEVLRVLTEADVLKKWKRKLKRKGEKKPKHGEMAAQEDDESQTKEEYLADFGNFVTEIQTKSFKEKITDVKFIQNYNSQLKNLLVVFYSKNYFDVFNIEEEKSS